MVEKRLYLCRDGEVWFSDQVLVIDGEDFRRKNLHYAHLGERCTCVGSSAFEGNYLTQVHFHKKMKFIERRAFADNKIEKLVFSRLEVPSIATDAFVGNPISLIIVPYETYDDYCKVLSEVDFDHEIKIVSNIAMKFEKLNENDKEDSVILILAKPIYGDYIWRIEQEEIVDFETKMANDDSQLDFGQIEIDGIFYHIYKDNYHQVILYRKENQHYIDMTYEDFERIYKDVTIRKDIL
ncbi:MAG: leucine-rich repeat protein [Traorella sp.]